MENCEQVKIFDDKITAAIDYARNELEVNYATIIGVLRLHIANLTNEVLLKDEEEES